MKILFIGNSHTYGYGMPCQCREMLKAQGGEVDVSMIAQPGQTLTWHSPRAQVDSAGLPLADYEFLLIVILIVILIVFLPSVLMFGTYRL